MFAQLIVDVPLMQTDHPYTYRVPLEWEDMLQPGMRVHVPFGKANRLVQGIVVCLTNQAPRQEVKEIVEVLDFLPVLGKEQLWLAQQLKETVFSYQISLLKAMLPNLLHSSYDKILHKEKGLSLKDEEEIFKGKASVHFSDLDKVNQARVMRLTQLGQIQLEYVAKDRQQIKTQKWFRPCLEQLSTVTFSNRAKKRQQLQAYLLEHPEATLLSHLQESYSADVVRYFREQGLIEVWEEELSRTDAFLKQ